MSFCDCENRVNRTSESDIIAWKTYAVMWTVHLSGRRTQPVSRESLLSISQPPPSTVCRGARAADGLATRRPLTFNLQRSRGRGFRPVVFIILKCSAKMEAGTLEPTWALMHISEGNHVISRLLCLGFVRFYRRDTAEFTTKNHFPANTEENLVCEGSQPDLSFHKLTVKKKKDSPMA